MDSENPSKLSTKPLSSLYSFCFASKVRLSWASSSRSNSMRCCVCSMLTLCASWRVRASCSWVSSCSICWSNGWACSINWAFSACLLAICCSMCRICWWAWSVLDWKMAICFSASKIWFWRAAFCLTNTSSSDFMLACWLRVWSAIVLASCKSCW